jgi:hypothetical protein
MLKKPEAAASPVTAVSPETARPPAKPYRAMLLFIEILLAGIMLISIFFVWLIRRSLPRK